MFYKAYNVTNRAPGKHQTGATVHGCNGTRAQSWHGCNTPCLAPSRHQDGRNGTRVQYSMPDTLEVPGRAQSWHGCNTPCLTPSRYQDGRNGTRGQYSTPGTIEAPGRAQSWHGCNTPHLAPSRHQDGRKVGTGAILHTWHPRGTRTGANKKTDGQTAAGSYTVLF